MDEYLWIQIDAAHAPPSKQWRTTDSINSDSEKDIVSRARDEEKEKIEVLMLLATFAVTISYAAGLNPPGGFWPHHRDGH